MTHYNNNAFTTDDVMEVERWLSLFDATQSENQPVDENLVEMLMNVYPDADRQTGLEVLKAFFNK